MGAKAGKRGLRPGAPIGESLRAFAHDILAEARKAIDDPDGTDATAVHDFRKAMKRWRAMLRLLEPLVGLDARRLRDEARDLARELAAARDSQAALNALADIAENDDGALTPRILATMRGRLESSRSAAETVAMTDAMRERLRAALEAGGRAVDHWPIDATEFAQVADVLGDAYARARAAIPADWEHASDEDLHTLRQRVVVHRYQMPLADSLWPRMNRLWVTEAQRLRDRLGAHQDLAVLSALAAPRQPLSYARARLEPLIVARKSAHVRASARIAARLFAERPRAFRRRLQAQWDAAR